MNELNVLIEGELIGRIRMNKAGRLSFDYEPGWRESPDGYSLSVSMPVASITYSHNLVSSHLWNLLPENPYILQRWGKQFTSPRRIRSSFYDSWAPTCRAPHNFFAHAPRYHSIATTPVDRLDQRG